MRSIGLRIEHKQQQALSPRLQQAVRLLQLSSLDFAQEVHNALCNNPFLDAEETEAEPVAVEPTPVLATDEVMAASAPVEEGYGDTLAGSSSDADLESERENWQADGFTGNRRGEDGDLTAMDMMAVETSLAEYLHGQLNVMSLSQRDLVLAKVVVESLDDDGYLRVDLPELVDIAELEPPATTEELQIALRMVQSLDPAGGSSSAMSTSSGRSTRR